MSRTINEILTISEREEYQFHITEEEAKVLHKFAEMIQDAAMMQTKLVDILDQHGYHYDTYTVEELRRAANLLTFWNFLE